MSGCVGARPTRAHKTIPPLSLRNCATCARTCAYNPFTALSVGKPLLSCKLLKCMTLFQFLSFVKIPSVHQETNAATKHRILSQMRISLREDAGTQSQRCSFMHLHSNCTIRTAVDWTFSIQQHYVLALQYVQQTVGPQNASAAR